LTRGSPKSRAGDPRRLGDERADLLRVEALRPGDACDLVLRRAGLICGSKPLPEAVTRSAGTGATVAGVRVAQRFDAYRHGVGQRRVERTLVEPLEEAALYGYGDVADGRLQKCLGSRKAGR